MKIAVITSTFPPYQAGIGNVAYHNALAVAQLGHQITVFTPDYGRGKIELPNIKIHYLKPLFKFGNAAFLPQLFVLLKDFDLIHLHYPAFGLAEVVWLAKLFGRVKKLVLHYQHDVVGHGGLRLFFKLHTKILLPLIIRSTDKVIVTSLDYAQHSNLQKIIKINSEQFAAVPNGVDINFFKPQDKSQELLTKYNLYDSLVVGFVGALDKAHYFKGVDNLIRSFYYLINEYKQANKKLPKLLIVGGGDLSPIYQDMVQQLGLSQQVIFAGRIANKDLVPYYNLMDLVVLPSIDQSEAFGIVLVEALACAKPIIASDLPGVCSVCTTDVGLLVKPSDVQDLANKINYLLSNLELRQQLGLAGRRVAEEKYGWERIGEMLVNIFSSV